MDISDTIIPKSDQLNAEDLLAGPCTFTIEKVERGSVEQPINIYLVEAPKRPWRPSKSMRRVLVHAWGKESSYYAGRRVTLYRDPEVKFGGDAVGGIKISHLSHIDERLSVALTVTRGKRAPHTVDPLPDLPTEPTAEQIAECADVDTLRALWQHCRTDARRDQIKARVAELTTTEEPA